MVLLGFESRNSRKSRKRAAPGIPVCLSSRIINLLSHSLKQQIKKRFKIEKCRANESAQAFTDARIAFKKHDTVIFTFSICRTERANRYTTASRTCSTLTDFSREFIPSKEMDSSTGPVPTHTETHSASEPAVTPAENISDAYTGDVRRVKNIIFSSPSPFWIHFLSTLRHQSVYQSAAAWN